MDKTDLRVRCPVCGAAVNTGKDGKVAEHVNKQSRHSKVCYGSMMPVFSGAKGELHPGELVYPSKRMSGPFD